MGILEKISDIEREIARTQKNKATEHHLGLLKAKLAKFRLQLLEPSKKGGAKGDGFDVMKSGGKYFVDNFDVFALIRVLAYRCSCGDDWVSIRR